MYYIQVCVQCTPRVTLTFGKKIWCVKNKPSVETELVGSKTVQEHCNEYHVIMRCKDGKGDIFDTWPQQLHRPSRGILTPGLASVGHVFVKYQIWMQCPELFKNCTVDARHSQQLHRVYLGYFDLWAVSIKYKRLKCTKYRREVFTKWPQQLHRALGYFESLPAHQGGALL